MTHLNSQPSKRDRYADVGHATREASARALAARASGVCKSFDLRVYIAVEYLLTTYSKLSDQAGIRQIASIIYQCDRDDLKGYQRTRVAESLRRLDAAGVIRYLAGKGRYARCTISLNALSDEVHWEESMHPERAINAPSTRASMHPPRVGHSEESSEKFSSEETKRCEKKGGRTRRSSDADGTGGRDEKPRDRLALRIYEHLREKNARTTYEECESLVDAARALNHSDEMVIEPCIGRCIEQDADSINYFKKSLLGERSGIGAATR